ncbi:hypothetical protein BCR36DRAFT_579057 [Piromyces finnis]|uniref:G-protein coupled receptors family 3 profile domain-containing protein n=1 Tax=Piromyces finnis TaxID=1754191 RepID=A0A1Y1VNZ5_9FUNG|nr:hypothetical protein BCR36DRAFT_579057 [Piromyces finnis]|eukprot:ORX60990.1 hypothetical protein BCR36DRAFT_579057 [Piromyces finnis]
MFNEYENIKNFYSVQSFVICSDEDYGKKDINTLLFWNAPYTYYFEIQAAIVNAFPIWLNMQRKERGMSFCLELYNSGWVDNVNKEICTDDPSTPCPDIIMLGTTQFAARINDSLNLNKYFKLYLKRHGKSIESMINKYSYYDYHLDNSWLAIPLLTDFRIFQFNMTTFDYCINKNYDLKYPPPYNMDYWGENYKEKWTWNKVLEYSKMITECTNKPGFSISRSNSYEDTKLFIIICQSLGIPFFTEDNDGTKKCGFRKKEYIEKLSLVKDLFENKYIEKWLVEDQVWEWRNNSYPKNIDEQPIFRIYESEDYTDGIKINGLHFVASYTDKCPDVKTVYTPGSSFLGGSGLIITKKTKFQDEAFDLIDILINDKYPFFVEINTATTPFENIHGNECNDSQKTKKELCHNILEMDGTYPYYYIKDNKTNVVYLTHIISNSERGVYINTNISQNLSLIDNTNKESYYMCDNQVNYERNSITYYDDFKIEFPINDNETIILKSMNDITKTYEQSNSLICSIYDEILKNAKPYQFPYSTFNEINEIEYKSPVSILLAHLYYKHNETNEGTFDNIINECCDIMDEILLPNCYNYNKIKISLGTCNEKTQKMSIEYLNCKPGSDIELYPEEIACPYIPYKNYKGIGIIVIISIAIIIKLTLLIVIIIYRKERCIYISGLGFLIILVLSSIVLDFSVYFWVGDIIKFKCITKLWLLICGITGILCSFAIKNEIIISAYNNNSITKVNSKYKSSIIYIVVIIIQIAVLIIWTFAQSGVDIKYNNLSNNAPYIYKTCSRGSQPLLSIIFGIDYILLFLLIYISYKGRNIPAEFNESKKVFISSLISILLLSLCYLSMMMEMVNEIQYIFISTATIITSVIIVILFVGIKLLIVFNIDIMSSVDNTSVVVVVSKNINGNEDTKEKMASGYIYNSGILI